MNLTEKEKNDLRDAVYMISDAKNKIEEINEAMKRDKRWKGQGDIAAVVHNLNQLCKQEAGGIGTFLKEL